MKIAFFGSSPVSSYPNRHGIYYRGLLKALAGLGHDITFFEPDTFGRQRRRDMPVRPWARVAIYPATSDGRRVLAHHTYERRAREVDALLEGMTQKGEAAA